MLMSKPYSAFVYFRVIGGFCGIVLVAVGSIHVMGEMLNRAGQFGPTAWLEFYGPVPLILWMINAGVLVTIILLTAQKMARRY